jgi:hypothetical protein
MFTDGQIANEHIPIMCTFYIFVQGNHEGLSHGMVSRGRV